MYRSIEKSQTLLINTQSKRLEKNGKKIIKFGFGQSPFLPPKRVMEALQASAHRKEYSSVQGDEELRSLIATFHHDHNGLLTNPDDILVAPGSKILLFNIVLSYESLDVILPGPSWVSYEPQVKLAGHNSIRINTTYERRWRLIGEDIKRAISQKKCRNTALIINYPGNPDGLTYTKDELEDIAEVCRKHNVLVISDEIYGLLDHNQSHISFGTIYPENTITTTGLSKWCGAGGWRLGLALLSEGISEGLKETLLGLGSETYSCAPMPVQIAAREAYRDFEETKGYLQYQVNILSQISKYCSSRLVENDIMTYNGEGGFYLFPSFKRLENQLSKIGVEGSSSLSERLLNDIGVATLPASAFGMSDDTFALRMAYVDFDESKFINTQFDLEDHCPNVIHGIEEIMDWVSKLMR